MTKRGKINSANEPVPIRLEHHLAQRMNRVVDEKMALQSLLEFHQSLMLAVMTETRRVWADIKRDHKLDFDAVNWLYDPHDFTIYPKKKNNEASSQDEPASPSSPSSDRRE